MRLASLLVPAAALFAATPASATSTIFCTPTGRPGLQLFLSVGNGAPPEGGIVSVRIVEGRGEIVTGDDRGGARLANPFVSPRALRFDVTMAGTLLARLNARTTRGPAYRGTLRWRGRASPVRCVWDEDQ
jgi:hypothetical protein